MTIKRKTVPKKTTNTKVSTKTFKNNSELMKFVNDLSDQAKKQKKKPTKPKKKKG